MVVTASTAASVPEAGGAGVPRGYRGGVPEAAEAVLPIAETMAAEEPYTLPDTGWRGHWRPLAAGIVVLALLAGLITASPLVQRSSSPRPGPYSATVEWPAAASADTTRIYLGRRVIDEFPSRAGRHSYEVHELWPRSRYRVTIEIYDAARRRL